MLVYLRVLLMVLFFVMFYDDDFIMVLAMTMINSYLCRCIQSNLGSLIMSVAVYSERKNPLVMAAMEYHHVSRGK